MTIGNYGCAKIDDNDSLVGYLKVYFSLWYWEFNFKNYKKNVYPLLLNSHQYFNDEKSIDNLNVEYVVLQSKNEIEIINWELKTVKNHIININKYFDKIDYNVKSILIGKQEHTYNDIKKNISDFYSKEQKELYLFRVIENSDINWQLYFLSLILKDYIKIEQFLIKKVVEKTQIPHRFKKETKYQKLDQPESIKENNPHKDIFKGEDNINFLIFHTFTKKYIIDFYADYSFLFQKMKSKTEDRLQNVKHLYFMEWLKTNNYISEKVYNNFVSKETFSTKYNSAQRENNYNNVISDLLE